MPVTGAFPAGVYLHLLETGIQAIQLSPYRADLPARRPIRLGTAAGFLACYFPRSPFQGQVSHQIQRHLLSIPARCAGDTTVRLMAHTVCKTVGSAYVGSNPTPATRFRRSKLVMQNCVTGILVQNERFCATDVNCATDIDVTQIGGSGSEPGYIRDRRARHFSRGSM